MKMTLYDFFKSTPSFALAFSGDVDSAYLLYEALQYGVRVRAYYVKTAFQPQFELDDAKRLSQELNADMRILHLDILGDDTITGNPPNRCYFCKKRLFPQLQTLRGRMGFIY